MSATLEAATLEMCKPAEAVRVLAQYNPTSESRARHTRTGTRSSFPPAPADTSVWSQRLLCGTVDFMAVLIARLWSCSRVFLSSSHLPRRMDGACLALPYKI